MNTDMNEKTGLADAATAMLAGAAEDLAQLAGAPVSFTLSEIAAPPVSNGVTADVLFAGAVSGRSQLIVSATAAAALAGGSTRVDLNSEESVASLTDVVTKFTEGAARALTTTFGTPVTLTSGDLAASEPLPPAPDAAVIEFVAAVGDQTDLAMSWELDSGVARQLADQWVVSAADAPVAATPSPAVAPGANSAPPPARSSGVIDSVELDVAVELGNVALTIGELLHLGEGSVVTLTQSVGDDVVMLANGTPVASGEVVVVDGTLGFRVSELITDTQGA
jgi:flagellar motor switch protein FliN/FliY